MMFRFLLVFVATCIVTSTQAQTNDSILYIGLNSAADVLELQPALGRYFIICKTDTLQLIDEYYKLVVKAKGSKLQLSNDSKDTLLSELKLVPLDLSHKINLVSNKNVKKYSYYGGLIIKPTDNKLKIINRVWLEDYVKGVVRTEMGKDAPFEAYKAQSVLARTYILKNRDKHKTEGFNLCTLEHCQVYGGVGKPNVLLDSACAATQGQVVTFKGQLIDALFYANSGGQTALAENVWKTPLPYITQKTDTFGVLYPGAFWEKTITRQQWDDYLQSKNTSSNTLVSPIQASRNKYFTYKGNTILYTDIRKKYALRSAYFDVYVDETTVTFCGYGFGHGVGMSQEGAMGMAKLGFDYKMIIDFYFSGVEITTLKQ